MPKQKDYVAIYVHWDVKHKFTNAVEEWHRGRKGYIADEAENALRDKTEELLAKIEARNGKK